MGGAKKKKAGTEKVLVGTRLLCSSCRECPLCSTPSSSHNLLLVTIHSLTLFLGGEAGGGGGVTRDEGGGRWEVEDGGCWEVEVRVGRGVLLHSAGLGHETSVWLHAWLEKLVFWAIILVNEKSGKRHK